MGLTDGLHIRDHVIAQLEDCPPAPEPTAAPLPAPVPVDASPVQQAMDATLTQTGADPPPRAS